MIVGVVVTVGKKKMPLHTFNSGENVVAWVGVCWVKFIIKSYGIRFCLGCSLTTLMVILCGLKVALLLIP